MVDVKFKKLQVLPDSPVPGTFYWIGEKVWFATESGPVLLSNEVSGDLLERLEHIEEDIKDINDILGSEGIDLSPYVTNDDLVERLEGIKSYIESRLEGLTGSDFGDFITREELEEYLKDYVPGIDDSDIDYDTIAEKVKEKLTWQII